MYVLALDQGTTSSRAIVFDQRGDVVAASRRELPQIFPAPSWVEHDPQEIWRSQMAVAKEAIAILHAAAGASAKIEAIGITNQRETVLVWDRKTGQPIFNAIVWQDKRTVSHCDALRSQGLDGLIQQKTGLLIDAYFSATKLAWLLNQVPGARARAEAGELAFGTVDSWLVWQLTGGATGGLHVTDASNASRTQLFNLTSMAWDAELLRIFNIPAAVLPRVVPTCGIVGLTDPTLFGRAIPIGGIAGDQQAATFGQACFSPGMAKNTYGTGCFMLLNTGSEPVASRHGLLATVAWQGQRDGDLPSTASENAKFSGRASCYALEGSVFMAGAIVQWLRDGLGIIRSASEIETLAASVDDSGDVFLVPAFSGLGAPDWDGYARGAIVGMTRGTNRAHIARAALDAIALQVADVFEVMTNDAGLNLSELRVDGGACQNDLLMQLQADLLGVPVVRPQVTETTALGAAQLAGLAVGLWADPAEITAQWKVERRFEPRMPDVARRSRRDRWREAVDRSRAWARG